MSGGGPARVEDPKWLEERHEFEIKEEIDRDHCRILLYVYCDNVHLMEFETVIEAELEKVH